MHKLCDQGMVSFFLIFLIHELASKLPPSTPRNGGPVLCVFHKILDYCCGVCCLGGRLFASGFERIWQSTSCSQLPLHWHCSWSHSCSTKSWRWLLLRATWWLWFVMAIILLAWVLRCLCLASPCTICFWKQFDFWFIQSSNSFVRDLRSVCFSSVSELKQTDLRLRTKEFEPVNESEIKLFSETNGVWRC